MAGRSTRSLGGTLKINHRALEITGLLALASLVNNLAILSLATWPSSIRDATALILMILAAVIRPPERKSFAAFCVLGGLLMATLDRVFIGLSRWVSAGPLGIADLFAVSFSIVVLAIVSAVVEITRRRGRRISAA